MYINYNKNTIIKWQFDENSLKQLLWVGTRIRIIISKYYNKILGLGIAYISSFSISYEEKPHPHENNSYCTYTVKKELLTMLSEDLAYFLSIGTQAIRKENTIFGLNNQPQGKTLFYFMITT